MAKRKSASNRATGGAGGASRSPKPQPANKNRSANPAGNTASKPPASSSPSKAPNHAVPKSQVTASRSSHGSQGIRNGAPKSQVTNDRTPSWIFGRGIEIRSSPPRPGNGNKQRVFQDQSSSAKQNERLHIHMRKVQHHPPSPQTTGFFSLFSTHRQPANSEKDTANGHPRIQTTTKIVLYRARPTPFNPSSLSGWPVPPVNRLVQATNKPRHSRRTPSSWIPGKAGVDTSLKVISVRVQKSSKPQPARGSSTVEVVKSPSAPRSKKIKVGSSSRTVIIPKKTTAHCESLPRQYTPTLRWRTSDTPKVVSAYSTLTAKPLPSPPKNELQNKVARKTIAKNPRLFKIVSPINVEAFEKNLEDHPNQPFVKSVVRALKNGFWPHANTSDPTFPTTYDGSRDRKLTTNQEFIRKQRDKEIELGRWSKPFGDKLLPGMHSSPIGAIPKSTPGKYRLINDQSSGPHALNSTIQKYQVKPTLDNIRDLGATLIAVRKKYPNRELVLFKSDVKDAYRQLPMHPLWQIKQIVSVGGKLHVDRCNTFGNRSGGWNWDSVASLVNWIAIEKKNIPDLLGYVDDNFGWEFAENTEYYKPYKKHLPAKQARLLKLWDELGIPHDEDKQLSGPSLPILGYEVDANAMTVKIPDEKMAKMIHLLRDYAHEGKTYTLKELQSAAGTVSAVLSLYPHLRPGLKGLFSEMAGIGKHVPIGERK